MAEHRQLCPKLLSLLKVWLKQTSLGGEEKERIEEAPSGDRTHDRTLTKRMLYQLSYRGCAIQLLLRSWRLGITVECQPGCGFSLSSLLVFLSFFGFPLFSQPSFPTVYCPVGEA